MTTLRAALDRAIEDQHSFQPDIIVSAIISAVDNGDNDFLHRAALAIDAGVDANPWIAERGSGA